MVRVCTDDIFLAHDTGDHPECAARLHSIRARLQETGLLQNVTLCSPVRATDEQILLCHSRSLLEQLEAWAASGGGRVEADTVMSRKSFEAARYAVGGVIDGVREAVTGTHRQMLCLNRPPGHHALRDRPMGFCLLSSVAIAAKTAIRDQSLSRVLIVDWDVHHGNGTQDAVYEDGAIWFFSVHRAPFYPGTGARSETGCGAGLGTVCNLPLRFGISRRDYLAAVEKELTDFADRCRPELVLVSAGFDAHAQDPIGSLGLETEDYETLTRLVQQIADIHAEGRVVSVLEGGYHLERLADCVELHLRTLQDAGSRDDRTPGAAR